MQDQCASENKRLASELKGPSSETKRLASVDMSRDHSAEPAAVSSANKDQSMASLVSEALSFASRDISEAELLDLLQQQQRLMQGQCCQADPDDSDDSVQSAVTALEVMEDADAAGCGLHRASAARCQDSQRESESARFEAHQMHDVVPAANVAAVGAAEPAAGNDMSEVSVVAALEQFGEPVGGERLGVSQSAAGYGSSSAEYASRSSVESDTPHDKGKVAVRDADKPAREHARRSIRSSRHAAAARFEQRRHLQVLPEEDDEDGEGAGEEQRSAPSTLSTAPRMHRSATSFFPAASADAASRTQNKGKGRVQFMPLPQEASNSASSISIRPVSPPCLANLSPPPGWRHTSSANNRAAAAAPVFGSVSASAPAPAPAPSAPRRTPLSSFFGTRRPRLRQGLPPKIDVERFHWCTHTRMFRKFVSEDGDEVCSVCRRPPVQGWLYVCSEDALDDRWRENKKFLAPWLVDAIKDGAYTDEEIDKILSQKQQVVVEAACDKNGPRQLVTMSDGDQPALEDASNGNAVFAPSRRLSVDEHREIQAGRMWPPRQIRWETAPCFFQACHTCRPQFEESSYMDLDSIVNSDQPLTSYLEACDFNERPLGDVRVFRQPGDWGVDSKQKYKQVSYLEGVSPSPGDAAVAVADQEALEHFINDDPVPRSLRAQSKLRRAQGSSSSRSTSNSAGDSAGDSASPSQLVPSGWLQSGVATGRAEASWHSMQTASMRQQQQHATATATANVNVNVNVQGSFDLYGVMADLADDVQVDDDDDDDEPPPVPEHRYGVGQDRESKRL